MKSRMPTSLPVKSVILAGGKGTRLRPLTLNTPKPIVPILTRPFLSLQLDLLRNTGIREVVLSLSYQPRAIERLFGKGGKGGKGHTGGVSIHYAMEPDPLGTAGAVKNAESLLSCRTVVLNGDVLSDIDLSDVLRFHEEKKAKVTIVLTPVDDPAAYGLVETDSDGRVVRFLEKPGEGELAELSCDTINAGIYIIEPDMLGLIPPGENYSFERGFFPSLLEQGEAFFAYVHRGYWIDIGTPEKYLKVHRDILGQAMRLEGFSPNAGGTLVHPEATVERGAEIGGPAYVGEGAVIKSGAKIGAYAVIGRNCRIESDAHIGNSVLWANCRVGASAIVQNALLGRSAHIGAHARITANSVLGDKSVVTDYSQLGPCIP